MSPILSPWVNIWYQKSFQIGVILVALGPPRILFLQDKLTKHPTFLKRLRHGYLVFTVVFIGWYALGQLSVVNVLTFVHALVQDFRWELFLTDPVIFILWVFTAASILLWARRVLWLGAAVRRPAGADQRGCAQAEDSAVRRALRSARAALGDQVHRPAGAVRYLA
ncbi:Regulatory protein NosR OS=Stutzerimonas stutzeri OX=316 GN=CXK95_03380 PE=4 SV=1 [Stutzerimonas stutzeri]